MVLPRLLRAVSLCARPTHARSLSVSHSFMQALESLRNFNGMVEILSALQATPIYRLRHTLQARARLAPPSHPYIRRSTNLTCTLCECMCASVCVCVSVCVFVRGCRGSRR
jgi:hypothetical protein